MINTVETVTKGRARASELEQTRQTLIKRNSRRISHRAVPSHNYARLAAVRMTLGVQNVGGQEVFVDRLTRSGQRSFCSRVRNRKRTHFTTNFTPYMTL
jgi:hypothetical protein